jgi:peptidoglycan-N-acetylglucosamine deacetylase
MRDTVLRANCETCYQHSIPLLLNFRSPLRGKVTRTLFAAPAIVLALHIAPAIPLARNFLPVTTRLRSGDAVALTFDDGPGYQLDALLELLDRAEARATFFVVGEQVERAPGRLREIVSCGHEVAVHCHRHRDHLLLTPRQAIEDMRRARGVIEEAAGRSMTLFRPPYGHFTLASLLEAGRQGWERVLWTHDGRDWDARATPQSIADNIGWPKAGDVFLLHDSDRYFSDPPPGSEHNTLRALPFILERASTVGLQVRSVGELLQQVAA